jgi:hypothetical protein
VLTHLGQSLTHSGFKNYGDMGDEFLKKVVPAQPGKFM